MAQRRVIGRVRDRLVADRVDVAGAALDKDATAPFPSVSSITWEAKPGNPAVLPPPGAPMMGWQAKL